MVAFSCHYLYIYVYTSDMSQICPVLVSLHGVPMGTPFLTWCRTIWCKVKRTSKLGDKDLKQAQTKMKQTSSTSNTMPQKWSFAPKEALKPKTTHTTKVINVINQQHIEY